MCPNFAGAHHALNEVDAAWRGEVLESVFRGAWRTLRVRTQADELRVEVPALAHPEVGETVEIGAAKFARWAFAGPESKAV